MYVTMGTSALPRVEALTEVKRGPWMWSHLQPSLCLAGPQHPPFPILPCSNTLLERGFPDTSTPLPPLPPPHLQSESCESGQCGASSRECADWPTGLRHRDVPWALACAWPQCCSLEGQEPNQRPIHQRGTSQCPACGLTFWAVRLSRWGIQQGVSPELKT